jgi:hypothetical protein
MKSNAKFRMKNMSTSKKLIDNGLLVGWAMNDITPEGPVSLWGQYYERISEYVQSPLKATAFAIESTNADGIKEQAVMVSVDLLYINKTLQNSLRNMIEDQIPDFNVKKLFINSTHTHSGPDPDVNEETRNLILNGAAKSVIHAWKNRKPAGISRALGYAVVGHSRRVQYADGSTEMYGSTSRKDFIGMEGSSNPGVDMLFTWDMNKKLMGIVINVWCPAQVTEAKYYVSSDYWGEVRKQVAQKFSNDVFILAQCGAAGDISPRDLPRGYKSGEPNMWDIPGIIEIGERLIHTIDRAYPEALANIQTKAVFKHLIKNIDLPTRRFSEKEYLEAISFMESVYSREPADPDSQETAWNRFLKEIKDNEKIMAFGPWDNKNTDFGIVKKKERLVDHYKKQDDDSFFSMELHVIRLGDVAFATNPFELFADYGFQIQGRSKAKQTFVVQVCCDTCGYLATQRAIEGGGYSAMANHVGPEGGKVLVEETIKLIDELWK